MREIVTFEEMIRTLKNYIDVLDKSQPEIDLATLIQALTVIKTLAYKLSDIASDKCYESATQAIADITQES